MEILTSIIVICTLIHCVSIPYNKHKHNHKQNDGWFNNGTHNLGNYNRGHCNYLNRNSGSYNFGGNNVGHSNLGSDNTGNHNFGNYNFGSCNQGDYNIGHFNRGNRISGYCSTIPSKDILIFNKPGKEEDWIRAVKPLWMEIPLTKWIPEEKMTDEQKQVIPFYKKINGYLECYSNRKAEYLGAWKKTSEEDRELTFKLPNFDAAVFKEIFGFNPHKELI